MNMQQQQPQQPRRQRSPWARYAPIIAVVVVVAIIAIVIGTRSSDDKKKNDVAVTPDSTPASVSGQNGVPLFYNDAKAQGTADQKKWHNCDTKTGLVAMPIASPPPCVEEFTGDNGGATATGVTGDTIKIGYYVAKPDPVGDALLKQTGAYDPPDDSAKAFQAYTDLYAGVYELYGRKIQLVRINGTGASSDAVAARADADRAAAAGVIAVMGGPTQAREFGEELAAKKVMCIGTCIIAAPEKFYK